ncbi:tachykinins isoform X2 [Drosophila grimshawi]|uniref:tachykinins isoform X2 n=1 Tax=Drosophila grimshawi TaxID=7222 RepID=UPI001C932CE8|nr:tachykinins isoform X2 [Drosophila grimshawi]
MHNQKMLLLLLLLTTVAVASGDIDGVAEDGDVHVDGISTLAPGTVTQPRKIVKRAPTNSFIGMRGKKELESSTDENWLGPDPLDYEGLVDVDNYYNENGRRLKKAPLAFVGMRGKKFNPNSNNNLLDLLQHMEEERVREYILQDFLDHLAIDGNGMAKRAPTGFTGMRGKRPTMTEGDAAAQDEDDAMELLQKRAPVNSFVGVRGKKDVSHQNYKRAALSEAYDVRGKKQRYADFNSKFVAVRGKKSELDDATGLEQNILQQQQPWVYIIGGKRAPNGFVGMRGKRPELVE